MDVRYSDVVDVWVDAGVEFVVDGGFVVGNDADFGSGGVAYSVGCCNHKTKIKHLI